MARVVLTSCAKEDVRDLDGSARQRVLKAIQKLKDEPQQRGQPLGSRESGNLTTFRKLVVGDREFRVIYRVEGDDIVVIWVVGRRADKECYDMALARLELYRSDFGLTQELERLLRETWTSED